MVTSSNLDLVRNSSIVTNTDWDLLVGSLVAMGDTLVIMGVTFTTMANTLDIMVGTLADTLAVIMVLIMVILIIMVLDIMAIMDLVIMVFVNLDTFPTHLVIKASILVFAVIATYYVTATSTTIHMVNVTILNSAKNSADITAQDPDIHLERHASIFTIQRKSGASIKNSITHPSTVNSVIVN